MKRKKIHPKRRRLKGLQVTSAGALDSSLEATG